MLLRAALYLLIFLNREKGFAIGTVNSHCNPWTWEPLLCHRHLEGKINNWCLNDLLCTTTHVFFPSDSSHPTGCTKSRISLCPHLLTCLNPNRWGKQAERLVVPTENFPLAAIKAAPLIQSSVLFVKFDNVFLWCLNQTCFVALIGLSFRSEWYLHLSNSNSKKQTNIGMHILLQWIDINKQTC